MIAKILLALLLPLPLLAQSTVRGLVVEQNSGSRPVPGVQIKVLGAAPELSDNAGAFALSFAAKKPGDRIIVQDVAKAGYELVNRDAVSNWLIPSDPQERTRIVLCPQGALARNMARYYDISLAALTRGYQEQVRRLQLQRDSARISAQAFGAQAKELADRFANQQKQLEELAQRFALENFDDCSDVQRRAFAAFSGGNVEEALRILETVNSEEEIAKAKAQREKSDRLERDVRRMRAGSDSVIRQNVRKLLFQADLYHASNRYAEAGRAHEAAALADTTNFAVVRKAADFFGGQLDIPRALRWGHAMLAAAHDPLDSAIALEKLGSLDMQRRRIPDAERSLRRALVVARRAMDDGETYGPVWVAAVRCSLAELLHQTGRTPEADTCAREALIIHRALVPFKPSFFNSFVIDNLLQLGDMQCSMARCDSGERFYHEALAILRGMPDTAATNLAAKFVRTYGALGAMYYHTGLYSKALPNVREAVTRCRLLATANPDAYLGGLTSHLQGLGRVECELKAYDSAEAHLTEADAIMQGLAKLDPRRYNPDRSNLLIALAELRSVRGAFDRAEQDCREALALVMREAESNPAPFEIWIISHTCNLGEVLMRAGRVDDADTVFAVALRRARALHATNPERSVGTLLVTMNRIARAIAPSRPSRAVELMQEALRLAMLIEDGPLNLHNVLSGLNRDLAKLMILSGDMTAAETHAREAIRYRPESSGRRYLPASLLYQGRFEEARAMYAELQDTICKDVQTYREAFLEDLDAFEKAGVTHPDAAKIRALLTQPPEPRK